MQSVKISIGGKSSLSSYTYMQMLAEISNSTLNLRRIVVDQNYIELFEEIIDENSRSKCEQRLPLFMTA